MSPRHRLPYQNWLDHPSLLLEFLPAFVPFYILTLTLLNVLLFLLVDSLFRSDLCTYLHGSPNSRDANKLPCKISSFMALRYELCMQSRKTSWMSSRCVIANFSDPTQSENVPEWLYYFGWILSTHVAYKERNSATFSHGSPLQNLFYPRVVSFQAVQDQDELRERASVTRIFLKITLS